MLLDVCLRVWTLLAQSPAAPAVEAAKTAAETAPQGFNWVRYILMVVYLMVCVGLIVVVLNTNQSAGGLSGMLGSGGENHQSYQGKKSFEENLKTLGHYLAVGFIVLSMAISYFMH